MHYYLAAQFVLCLSIGSSHLASTSDDNADLPWMRKKMNGVIDLANTTIDLSKSYDGNHSVVLRNFRTLETYMKFIIEPAEDFIMHLGLEENGNWEQATFPRKTFKSYAWIRVRSILWTASDAIDFIAGSQLRSESAGVQTAVSIWEEAKENVDSLTEKLNDLKNSSFLNVDPG